MPDLFSTEARATVAGAALGGLRVADVMTRDPVVAPAWIWVQDFIDRVLAHTRQSVYPVVEFDGRLSGLVTGDMLARLRPEARARLRVGQAALPVPGESAAGPDEPAPSLAARPPVGGTLVAVVIDHGRVVGLVSTADLEWAMRRARLAAGPPAPRRSPDDDEPGAPGGTWHAHRGAQV